MSDNKFDGVWGFNVEEVIKDSVEPERTNKGIIISDHLDIDHKFSEEKILSAIRLMKYIEGGDYDV